jgi:ATP adenylyltransferase/5',5'''-P-1,P-4-tetraphosphate phosphorylase II
MINTTSSINGTTIEFKKQTDPLLPSDLRATWEILSQLSQPALAFYNCGELSGARYVAAFYTEQWVTYVF